MKKLLLLPFFFFMSPAFAATLKSYDQLPSLYRSAFKLNANLKNDSLEVFLETFHGYNAYKDNLKFESEDFELTLKETSPSYRTLDPVTKKLKEFYKDQ